MFKKTEESEWSRFSRALSGQSRGNAEEEETKEEPVVEPEPLPREPMPREAVAREAAPIQRDAPQPVVTPAPSAPPVARPTPQQSYTRTHNSFQQQDSDEAETVIGAQSSFDGTLKCQTNLRIRGTAQGEISCGKSVVIEESAKVNANIKSANVVVAGQVEGSIVCEGRLEVMATGRVSGELTAAVLIIQEGAFFEGHLTMKDREPDHQPQHTPTRGRHASSEGMVN
ncbi:MAG TPA: polymer-forming cytoskeletal protein [Chloroflexota bacterium]|nr:polymer-forming cytoskeletal protein [Chloroflexota bacterium]